MTRSCSPVLLTLLSLAFLFASRCTLAGTSTEVLLGEGESWETPIYINDSKIDGPTVLVTGGIHGNEQAGYRAADQIRHWPIASGKLVVIPRVNTKGLVANTRYIPLASKEQRDLNRNFPSPGIAQNPRGDIATALWQFVVELDPDWHFDLHEGYEFNISHKPKPGKDKSVGSTIIYDRSQQLDIFTDRMLTSVNALVAAPERKFLLKTRGPKRTSLASAVINVLGKKAMILETTFKDQRLPIRTRQHRAMMNAALLQIGMIDSDCRSVLTPVGENRQARTFVALYDDAGGSERGVANLTNVFDAAADIAVTHLGAEDITPEVLTQFDVVVFGGGSGSREAATIGKIGSQTVKQFVNDGGGYIGVCAGAYLCSSHYSWSLDLVDTQVLTGKRQVEGVGMKSMWYRGKSTTQKMQLTEQGSKLFQDCPENVSVIYQNGPIVSPGGSAELTPYTVLAWFRSEKVLYPPQEGTMIDTPAIVSGKYGKGHVISISPHPEATEGLGSILAQSVRSVAKHRNISASQ